MSLLATQWEGYPRYHGSRKNLLVHVFAVPAAQAGVLALVAAPLVAWWLAPIGVVAAGAGIAAQGAGHKREVNPPVPFKSKGEAIGRLLGEQFINFPRFVLTGGFARAWRAAR